VEKSTHPAKEIRSMRHSCFIAVMMVTAIFPLTLLHAQSKEETSSAKAEATAKTETSKPEQFKPEQQQTKGSPGSQ
jgi:hypothetical protein